ncbi:MAG: 50S ribosomal protein L23 [Altererythrobacter sp. XM-24bin4]|jgi:large subunit ribosomal protein L23|uniref:Large ribosomal subunit protein uL23 n=1 Tax=Altererythrobacter rubellus TaxID=2173831 RepID=A0A9Y2BBM1_9SPHN|nr:50S ribosomal protein L23 [Altererythrobacter rubellus]NNE49929.1 50S ribosomal protein L23 [Altererythrobacter sp.]NNF94277.1 50S ribosomal protein L23 [Altererythrobacter sp.]PWL25839.1 MAG: 50S ribosomal protein L23 [Altererythrobacter sp. XM-24bin4]WIW96560.1 50S ribosomal protein L23 [Altererythrobacter rubellus]
MAKKQEIDARHYDVILAPHITEKSTMASENNAVVFKVSGDATKPQIKEAVEAIYDKKVVNVNTINVKGKTKRWKGKPYKRNDVKKAIVTLAEGEMIDITSGI